MMNYQCQKVLLTVTIIIVIIDNTNDMDFVVSDLTVAGDSGSTGMTPGDTLTIAGGTNVSTSMSGDTLTITSTDTNTDVDVSKANLLLHAYIHNIVNILLVSK